MSKVKKPCLIRILTKLDKIEISSRTKKIFIHLFEIFLAPSRSPAFRTKKGEKRPEANTKSVLARFCDIDWEKEEDILEICHAKK